MSGPRLPTPGSAADLWAGLAGGVFAPAASFGFGLPLWAALPGAVLVFFGVRLAFAPRGLFEGLDPAALDAAGMEVAREVIPAARADLARLRSAGLAVRAPDIRARLDHLHTVAARVVADVERSPKRLPRVQRLLTYYLPAAFRLGEGFGVLEATNRPDRARLAATAAMIARLDTVFARHADRLSAAEVEGLDVELRLLSDAIRAEERGLPETPGQHASPPEVRPAPEVSPWR